MQKFSLRITVSLLTFALSTGWVFQVAAEKNDRVQTTEVFSSRKPVPPRKTLEMVFVVDTTGSMGGLIEGAKQKIWSIVNDVMQRRDRPKVKVGLVAYRDNGDAYVTQVLPLSEDLDKVYSTLMDYQASGGGDTPENVRRALAEGVDKAGWTKQNPDTAQILFLVGDAPPQNYAQEPDVLETTARAVRQNMIVNTIQCGAAADTRQIWQQIAARGEGKYFAIAQDGGVQAISTPYDSKLAELATKLGNTYLPYGGGAGEAGRRYREDQKKKQDSTESKISRDASVVAQADRAMNKVINTSAYSGDLLQAIENKTVKLESVKEEDLPDDLKKLSPAAREKEIERRLAERKKIRDEILVLSKQRDAFIQEARKKTGRQDGFDAAVSRALNEQMTRKGIK